MKPHRYVRRATTWFVLLIVAIVGTISPARATTTTPAAASTYAYDVRADNLSPTAERVSTPSGSTASDLEYDGRAPADLSRVSPVFVAAETAGDVGASSAARGGAYSLGDEAGNVVRTGRTNNLAARETAHANDPVLGDYQFNVEYRTDAYAEQRGLEQVLYDRYPGAQAANGGLNKIRGISPTNPNLDFYMQSAWNFLGGG